MSAKIIKFHIIILFTVLFCSCGLLKESNNEIVYKSINHDDYKPSNEPNYNNLDSWLVHPYQKEKLPFLTENDGSKNADVFFIAPTLFSDKKNENWNSDVYDEEFRNYLINSTIKFQATAWLDAGNLYSPNYRQAHFRVFDDRYWEFGGEKTFELAYKDIKEAFLIYMNKHNKGRPIIIAGHSQGAAHAVMLLKDFFDGKELQNKLIAAYLPGTKITDEDFFELELMKDPLETGGYLTWNTFKILKNYKKYDLTIPLDWLEGSQVSNPVLWDDSETSDYKSHKGLYFVNEKVYKKSVKIEYTDYAIFIKMPRVNILKTILFSFLKDYHKGDINLFWEDIRLNAIDRVESYFSEL